jgi:hypothetical protein
MFVIRIKGDFPLDISFLLHNSVTGTLIIVILYSQIPFAMYWMKDRGGLRSVRYCKETNENGKRKQREYLLQI